MLAWRIRHRSIMWLHATLFVTLALAIVSVSRIDGPVYPYLLLWVPALTAGILVATGWTVMVHVSPIRGVPRLGAITIVGVLIILTTLTTTDATKTEPPWPPTSTTLAALVGPTSRALRAQPPPYLVTWSPDALSQSGGYGLLDELERRGLNVRVAPSARLGATAHRVVDRGHAAPEVHFVVGPDIAAWRARPDFREVVSFDPRTAKERAAWDALRQQVDEELIAAGQSALVPHAGDGNQFLLLIDPAVPPPVKAHVARMMQQIGIPAAVFIRTR
jgi:hypothetical protein